MTDRERVDALKAAVTCADGSDRLGWLTALLAEAGRSGIAWQVADPQAVFEALAECRLLLSGLEKAADGLRDQPEPAGEPASDDIPF